MGRNGLFWDIVVGGRRERYCLRVRKGVAVRSAEDVQSQEISIHTPARVVTTCFFNQQTKMQISIHATTTELFVLHKVHILTHNVHTFPLIF